MTIEPNRLPLLSLWLERPFLSSIDGRTSEHWMATDQPDAPNFSFVVHKDVH